MGRVRLVSQVSFSYYTILAVPTTLVHPTNLLLKVFLSRIGGVMPLGFNLTSVGLPCSPLKDRDGLKGPRHPREVHLSMVVC